MRAVLLSFISAITAGAAAPALAQDFSFEGQVASVSDYRWRGVSVSDERAALQIEGALSHEGGAWLWGNLNSVAEAHGGAELGLGAGYTSALGPLEWTVGVTRYVYPRGEALDFTQYSMSAATAVSALTISAGFEYTPASDNLAGDDSYLWLDLDVAAPRGLQFKAHVGRDDGIMAPAPNAIDYSLGVDAPLGAMRAGLSVVGVDTIESAWVFRLAYAIAPD